MTSPAGRLHSRGQRRTRPGGSAATLTHAGGPGAYHGETRRRRTPVTCCAGAEVSSSCVCGCPDPACGCTPCHRRCSEPGSARPAVTLHVDVGKAARHVRPTSPRWPKDTRLALTARRSPRSSLGREPEQTPGPKGREAGREAEGSPDLQPRNGTQRSWDTCRGGGGAVVSSHPDFSPTKPVEHPESGNKCRPWT